MALAYLCSKIRPTDHWFRVADHPVSAPFGIIVDHGMREGSDVEAAKVAQAIKEIGVKPQVVKLQWDGIVEKGGSPNDLPNVETVARELRYRRLGMLCRTWKVTTLLTAHHEDDQYETVLMRLLSGHGYRGLQGMRPATDIPECYDLHNVYQSGLIDDQRLDSPLYNMRPTEHEKKQVRRELRDEVDPAVIRKEIEDGLRADIASTYLDDEYDGIAKGSKRAPPLAPLESEDGGVMVYRPLLHFGKDRLIATCLENRIPWFEDHTNADQTLTMRNAVRHMCRNHTLPAALQKPAILRLAQRCRARVAAEEAEADRLLDRVLVHEFGQNAGTLVVTLHPFAFPTAPRRSSRSPTARRKRIAHYRLIAALLIRRLISMVTPERELSQVAQLGHLVSMLFPSLAEDGSPPEPKAYVICGVHFTPLVGDYPLRWLLSRAPHASNLPRPSVTFPQVALAKRIGKHPSAWKTGGWHEARMFDGRYWVSILHRLPCKVLVAPFEMEHHKPFREGLADESTRRELAAALRRYAPGKVRYTLPAIYATMDVSNLLEGGDWWPAQPPSTDPAALSDADENMEESEVIRKIRARNGKGLSKVLAGRLEWERQMKKEAKPQLLALPTMGFFLPGLGDWLRWEVRYRKVDSKLLQMSKLGARRLRRHELRHRVRSLYRCARLCQQRQGSSRSRR